MNSDDADHGDLHSGDTAPREPAAAARSGRRWFRFGLSVVVIAAALAPVAVWLAGRDDATAVDADRAPTTAPPAGPSAGGDEVAGTGQVDVRLEETGGIFIEGFEVGLRFETVEGETLAAMRWNEEFADVGRQDIHAYYDSVYHQTVPAGSVVVRAEANTGAGPPPSVPDLSGDLPCSVTVDVAPGETVTLEVSFEGGDGCLRIVDGTVPG